MSGRCRGCNCILTEDELTTKWPNTNEYLDLCFGCVSSSENIEEDPMNVDLISIEEFPESLE